MPIVSGGAQVSGSGQIADGIILNADISPTAAIARSKLADVSATSRVIGRKTAGAGADEEVTLSELLDFVGSAAQGDILYRNGTGWVRLGAGTSGYFLKTNGAGANPAWAAVSADMKIIEATRAQNGGNGGVTYAHGLGRTPLGVRIYAAGAFNGGGTASQSFSQGGYDGTSNRCVYLRTSVTGSAGTAGAQSAAAIYMTDQAGGSQSGVITVDGTNVTITWTSGGSPETETFNIVMEVF